MLNLFVDLLNIAIIAVIKKPIEQKINQDELPKYSIINPAANVAIGISPWEIILVIEETLIS